LATIKIKDLPHDMAITEEDMKKITGGYSLVYNPRIYTPTLNFPIKPMKPQPAPSVIPICIPCA